MTDVMLNLQFEQADKFLLPLNFHPAAMNPQVRHQHGKFYAATCFSAR
jgi:hypothetical protein